jgi:ATP-binding cassette, subfamily B, bacterial
VSRPTQRDALRRAWAILGPNRRRALLGAVLVVASTALVLAAPAVIRYGVDKGIGHHDGGALDRAVLVLLAAALLAYVLHRAVLIVANTVAEDFLYDLRVRVFEHLQSLSMGFYDRQRSGVLVSRMTSDVDVISNLAQEGLLTLVQAMLTMVIALAVMLALSPLLTGVCVVLLIPVVFATRRFRRQASAAFRGVQDELGLMLTSVQEGLTGVRVVQAFAAGDEMIDRFRVRNRALYAAQLRAARVSTWYFPVIESAGLVGTAVVVVVGGLLAAHGTVSLGTVVAFVLYVESLFSPVLDLSYVLQSAQLAGAGLRNVVEILDTAPEVREDAGAVALPACGAIAVRGVSFAYEAGGREVLHGVDLDVAPGERLAFVGPTGAGKSTLAKLIARLYDPRAGSIELGGVDLRRASLRSLRERIAVVPQEGFLFAGTIRENVRLARGDATDAEVRDALRAVGALERFASLPDGLDTGTGTRGSRLSAGERQLISLARIALAPPAVLILDEATSSLDPRTERLVERAMERLTEGCTVIAIAHRLTTAVAADRVALVDGGGIAELGSHDELVAAGGRYAALYRSWLG